MTNILRLFSSPFSPVRRAGFPKGLQVFIVSIVALFSALTGRAQISQTITASVTTTGNIYAGQQVNFSASGSNTGYTWTGTSGGSDGYMSYSSPGTYTVTVQAPASGGPSQKGS